MRAAPLLPLIFAFVITAYSIMGEARWVCTPCQTEEECETEPQDLCLWGVTRDNCNRKTCSKGPGERCGGPQDVLGHCGNGMWCQSDEKCHGCPTARNSECYSP